MALHLQDIKKQFPIFNSLERELHYLDNAATCQVPEQVLNAMREHDANWRANVYRGVHALSEGATQAYQKARQKIGAFLNAKTSDEVIFTSGTTMSINMVAHMMEEILQAGDEILLSELEHHSNIVPWQMLSLRCGVVIRYLPINREGSIDLDQLDTYLNSKTKLVAITHVSNVTGGETDLLKLSKKVKEVGAALLIDGAQKIAHGPVDVQKIDADFYAFSGHKLYGPMGIGVLWMKKDWHQKLPPFLGGGDMIKRVTKEKTTYGEPPRCFEAGTPPVTQAVGLAAAIDWISNYNWDDIIQHESELSEHLYEGLNKFDDIQIIGSASLLKHPIASFVLRGLHPHDICQVLDQYGIAVRGGHHCAQLAMDAYDVTSTTRVSLGIYNSHEDIVSFLNALRKAIHTLS